MPTAPESLTGMALEWTGHHRSASSDLHDLSTHTDFYETETPCYVLAEGRLVSEAGYTYRRLDAQMGIVIFHPETYQERKDIVLNAIFDFSEMTD